MGFDWRPETGELYANDIGTNYLGDDFPPEELNRIEPDAFYGYPYVYGAGRADPKFGPGHESRIREAPSLRSTLTAPRWG